MTGLKLKYFVLKPEGDNMYARASREAMREYAFIIDPTNQALADDLRAWLSSVSPDNEGE